ncbi:PEPxxWA-CTERM sorting domain-containing protein [Duganella radicis]|uniref:PEPxxWA-CTERM sorting domain-containing protein n=1 Tax=Duganella radicis TaxID=551988 RepID=A0A6L6PEQ2_9BURK|nr:PEPxxWA-CTERM sorting domain-containing protein [Duganella radicis]
MSGGSGFFGHAITGNNVANTFADHYTFTVGAGSSIFADTFSSSGNAKNGLDILDLSLFNADGLVLKGTQLSTGKTDQWELSSGPLAAGNYFLLVTGTVLSKAAGSYTGSATVSAVPEPATYGMLLGGLGLVGALARRQRKSSDAA